MRVTDRQREEIIAYNEILDHADRKVNPDDNDQTFAFETILDHRRAKNRKYEVLVQWSTGEETWEPLRLMIKEDPITLATYAAKNRLLDEDQWKRQLITVRRSTS